MLPQIFLDYFHENQTTYSHHTRQKTIFICIVFTQLLVKGLFKFHGASLWNEFPKYVKDIQSDKKFKELLKLHLLS